MVFFVTWTRSRPTSPPLRKCDICHKKLVREDLQNCDIAMHCDCRRLWLLDAWHNFVIYNCRSPALRVTWLSMTGPTQGERSQTSAAETSQVWSSLATARSMWSTPATGTTPNSEEHGRSLRVSNIVISTTIYDMLLIWILLSKLFAATMLSWVLAMSTLSTLPTRTSWSETGPS